MKRPIAALGMPDVVPGTPATKPPVVMMVRPGELLVDPAYQRDLSEPSVRLIRRIVAEWDWRKYKAPCVAMTDEGPVVLDGQHTATAAASHPGIGEIPVLVVEAPHQRDQAEAFVGLNVNRLAMTAMQIHVANIAAGEAKALSIESACRLAGIRLLRTPPSNGAFKPRDTIALAAVAGLIARRGENSAALILSLLARLSYGPITAAHIRGLEHLTTDPEFVELAPTDIPKLIKSVGIEAAEREAKAFAATHGLPLWRALAAVWFKARRARRKAAQPTTGESPAVGDEERAERKSPAAPQKVQPGQRLTAPPLREEVAEGIAPIVGPKNDQRRARDGWMPGSATRRCERCHEPFNGDRRAYVCADCVYGEREATDAR